MHDEKPEKVLRSEKRVRKGKRGRREQVPERNPAVSERDPSVSKQDPEAEFMPVLTKLRFDRGAKLALAASVGFVFACIRAPPIGSAPALEEAQRILDDEGDERADTSIVAALRSHGSGPTDAEVLKRAALRALLEESWSRASLIERGNAAGLREAALTRWRGIAAEPLPARLGAIAKLAGFDAAAPPRLVTVAEASEAAAHLQLDLDVRAQGQVAAAHEAAARAIGEHLDLARDRAEARAAALEAAARDSARASVLAFAGERAAHPSDLEHAAADAFTRSWLQWMDRSFPDDAWPAIARALALSEVPAAHPCRPAIAILESGGLTCRTEPLGLRCAGRVGPAGRIALRLDGTTVAITVPPTAPASDALSRFVRALPEEFAGTILVQSDDGLEALLRLDRATPRADPAVAAISISSADDGPLVLRGRLRQHGWRPSALADYQGNELRVLLRLERETNAPSAFELPVPVSSRLPLRLFEIQVVAQDGALVAARVLDHRAAEARSPLPEEEARAPPTNSASAGASLGKRKT